MKRLALFLVGLLTLNGTMDAKEQSSSAEKNVLVAYFSCTGTTERVATAIAKEVDGKLYRITPAQPYTSADLNWNDSSSRSSIEMNDEKARPDIAGEKIDLKDYDVIFVGYPIWSGLCPRPVNTFLEKYDFTGKVVIPFATSGGSTIDNSISNLKQLYPKMNLKQGRLCNGGTRQAANWAKNAIK